MAENNENKELKNNIQLQEEKNKKIKEGIDLLSKQLGVSKELSQEERASRTEYIAMMARIAAKQNDVTELEKQRLAFAKEAIKIEKPAFDETNKLLIKKYEQMKLNAEMLGLNIKHLKGFIKENDKLNESLAEGESFGNNFFGGIASHLGLASDMTKTFAGKLDQLFEIAEEADGFEGLFRSFNKIFTIQNLVYSAGMAVMQMTIQVALATDKASAAFAKQTGAGQLLRDEIYRVGSNYRNLGLNAELAGEASVGLYKNYPGFMRLSEEKRESLIKLSASLGKLGVAYEDQGAILTHYTKAHRMSNYEVQSMMKTMALSARGLQMGMDEYIKGFTEANKSLAVYGRNAPKIYQKIAAAAQEAGSSTGRLLEIAAKFDTFESSAETAGKLNAILGTQFSAMDMLATTEEERIENLIRTMQAQGIIFKDLDRYTQKAIAATLGIEDLSEAQRILGMDMGQYQSMLQRAAAEAKKHEEFANRMKQAMDIMEKLKNILINLAITFEPTLNGAVEMAQALLDLSQSFRGLPMKIAGMVLGFTLFWKTVRLLVPGVGLLNRLIGAKLAAKFGITGAGAASGSGGVATFGQIAALSAKQIMALGVAMLLLGLGIAAIVYSAAALAETGPMGLAALTLIGIGIYFLSGAFTTLGANPFAIIGAKIIIAFVLAISMLILVLALFVTNVSAGFMAINEFIDKSEDLTKASSALIKLGKAFSFLNMAMSGGGVLGFLSGGLFKGVGASPIKQMIDDLTPLLDKSDDLAVIFEGLGKIADADIATIFGNFSQGLGDIEKLMNSKQGVQISHTLENLALITTGTSAQSKNNTTSVLSGGLEKLAKLIKGQQEITLKLDAATTQSFLEGNTVKVINQSN